MIYYLPIENLDSRYSRYMNEQVEAYLDRLDTPYTTIEPYIDTKEPPEGCFLHASQSCNFKARQLEFISRQYRDNKMNDRDIIFCADLWFPGIEMISYMNHFHHVDVKLRGFIHAGSWTDTDEVAKFEYWAHNFENMVFSIAERVFFATRFSRDECVIKRNLDISKAEVTPLPLDYTKLNRFRGSEKRNLIVFNGRNHPEKQPDLWKQLVEHFKDRDWDFQWTMEVPRSKAEYYALLSEAKIVVSFALQENFGIGVLEATYLGCTPVVPNRLAYKELFSPQFRYDNWKECVGLVEKIMNTSFVDDQFPRWIKTDLSFQKWFKRL